VASGVIDGTPVLDGTPRTRAASPSCVMGVEDVRAQQWLPALTDAIAHLTSPLL
jgi:hypothetical protein